MRYLLLAGTRPDAGPGPDGVRATFAGEAEARRAFVALRLSPAYRHGWAEVVGVGPGGIVRRVCWFGNRATAAGPDVEPGPSGPRSGVAAPEAGHRPGRLRKLLASLSIVAALAVAATGCLDTGAAEERPAVTPGHQIVPFVPPEVPAVPGVGMDG